MAGMRVSVVVPISLLMAIIIVVISVSEGEKGVVKKAPLAEWFEFTTVLYRLTKGRAQMTDLHEPLVDRLLRQHKVHCHHFLDMSAAKKVDELDESAKNFLRMLVWRAKLIYGDDPLTSWPIHGNETKETRLVQHVNTDYRRLDSAAKRSLHQTFPLVATTSERFVARHLALYALKVRLHTKGLKGLEHQVGKRESVSQILVEGKTNEEAALFTDILNFVVNETDQMGLGMDKPKELTPALEAFLKEVVSRMDRFLANNNHFDSDLLAYAKDVKGLYDGLDDGGEAEKALWAAFPNVLHHVDKWGSHDAVMLFLNSLRLMEKDIKIDQAKLICG